MLPPPPPLLADVIATVFDVHPARRLRQLAQHPLKSSMVRSRTLALRLSYSPLPALGCRRRLLLASAAAAPAWCSPAALSSRPSAVRDLEHLMRAAEVSQSPVGETQPHPYAGCVLVAADGCTLAEASQRAQVRRDAVACQGRRAARATDTPRQLISSVAPTRAVVACWSLQQWDVRPCPHGGSSSCMPLAEASAASLVGLRAAHACPAVQGTEPPECQAVRLAGGAARGSTAYLNLETGDCHGEAAAVEALVQAGVARVVVGLRHPLPHLRGGAVAALRGAGLAVAVLGEAPCSAPEQLREAALDACLAANEALLHRAVARRPLGLLKYAMTLDGKIATHTGHSAWVSSAASRQRVFEARAASDAVIVGGCTGEERGGGAQPGRRHPC